MNAVVDLFGHRARERRAEELWPGDRVRRQGRTWVIQWVRITPGAAVRIEARTVTGARQTFDVDPAEIVPVLP